MNFNNEGEFTPGKELKLNFKIPKQKDPSSVNSTMLNYTTPLNWSPAGEMKPAGLMGPWATYPTYQPAAPTPSVISAPPIYNITNLKRRLETPKNINPSMNFKELVTPDLTDPSLPKELTSLFQPLYCKLCTSHLSSTSNAKLHYKSKNHEKRVRKFLVDHSEKTGEPLHKRALITTNPHQDENPKNYYCETCDLHLTSKLHAEQHYMGRNHQKAVIKAKPPAGSGYYDSEGKWHRTTKPAVDLTGRNGIGLSFLTPQERQRRRQRINPKFYCDLCKISTTSAQHYQSHMNGQKHLKMVRKFGGNISTDADPYQDLVCLPKPQDSILNSVTQGEIEKKDYSVYRTPTGKFYCQPCNLTLNSEIQFHQHLESKKHLKNKNAQK